MQAHASLIRELEESIRGGSHDHRVLTLRRVTDLFVHRAEQYDEEQVKLFDGVIGQLAAEIEKSALSELVSRLAPIANAPIAVIHSLARNDEISVSGAVLTQSVRLGESDLIERSRAQRARHICLRFAAANAFLPR